MRSGTGDVVRFEYHKLFRYMHSLSWRSAENLSATLMPIGYLFQCSRDSVTMITLALLSLL